VRNRLYEGALVRKVPRDDLVERGHRESDPVQRAAHAAGSDRKWKRDAGLFDEGRFDSLLAFFCGIPIDWLELPMVA